MKAGMNRYSHLFGPVPSRRLGRSLGVDLTPFKTCTLDCIFCQLGRTTVKTAERREYVPTNSVTKEIEAWLKIDGKADYITLSGSGEPTLHNRFGEIIDFIHECTKIPVALLTNGTTLHLPAVRSAAARADVVKVTLSAWDQKSFEHIHRPCVDVTFRRLANGERRLRDEFWGQIWMEVFLLGGINSTRADVQRIAKVARQIKPDRIQLNTCIRPSAEDFAFAVEKEQMAELAKIFDPPAEVIAESHATQRSAGRTNETIIFDMLRRRPCTAAQIANAFGMHLNEVSKHVGALIQAGRIRAERRNLEVYFGEDSRGMR